MHDDDKRVQKNTAKAALRNSAHTFKRRGAAGSWPGRNVRPES